MANARVVALMLLAIGCAYQQPPTYIEPPADSYSTETVDLKIGETVASVQSATVAADFFRAAKIGPHMGRFFVDHDHASSSRPVVVLSHDLWAQHFASSASTIGRELELGGRRTTVVGVAPRGFRFPEGTLLWTPKGAAPADEPRSEESQESATARDVKRIEEQLATTWRNGDCEAWGAFLAAQWSVIHITGAVITKSEALEMCKAPRAPIESLAADELSVRSFDDAAVVTGRTTMITGGTNPQTVRLRFTDVFIRRAGRWQIVASHATRLGS